MSALNRFSDSSRTSPKVREVPTTDIGPSRAFVGLSMVACVAAPALRPSVSLASEEVVDAKLARYSGLTATLRNLITPSPCCSVNGPSANRPLCNSAVFWPLSTTVIWRPLAVIS
jgi:hypothetical protein